MRFALGASGRTAGSRPPPSSTIADVPCSVRNAAALADASTLAGSGFPSTGVKPSANPLSMEWSARVVCTRCSRRCQVPSTATQTVSIRTSGHGRQVLQAMPSSTPARSLPSRTRRWPAVPVSTSREESFSLIASTPFTRCGASRSVTASIESVGEPTRREVAAEAEPARVRELLVLRLGLLTDDQAGCAISATTWPSSRPSTIRRRAA